MGKKSFLNQLLGFGKTLFIGIVVSLIFLEFYKLRSEISVPQLWAIMSSVGIWKMAGLTGLSLIALLPLLNYDVIFNRVLQTDYQKPYILSRSIIINTLNNMIGFAGFINMGLRLHYYSTEHSRKDLLKLLLKSYLFYFSGCSVLALVGFVYVLLSSHSVLHGYWIWLLLGILYFPLTIIISRYREKEGSMFSVRDALAFSTTSIVEWVLAFGVFFLIGRVLAVQLPWLEILTVFIIAYLFGLASMMPGALGSFDLIVLTLFGALGLPQELVVSWLLLYRFCYYIVPFVIGCGVLVVTSLHTFNKKQNDFPSRIFKSFSADVLTFCLYLLGIDTVLSAMIPEEIINIRWLSQFHPVHANLIYQYPSILLGFSFILLGRANRQHVKRAYAPTIAFLVAGCLYCGWVNYGILTLFFFLITIVLAVYSKSQGKCEQFVYSLESFTKDAMVYVMVVLTAVIMGTRNYSDVYFRYRFKHFLIDPLGNDISRVSLFIFLLFLSQYLLLRYLKGKQITIGEKPNFDEITHLLSETHVSNNATLVYLNDKLIFPYRDEEGRLRAFMQFYKIRDKLLVMGEPFGDKEGCDIILPQFLEEATRYGYHPVFYEVPRKFTMALHDYGFHFIKSGETAFVDLTTFTMLGSRKRNFRNVLSKFEKNGITFEVLKPPHSLPMMEELAVVSDKWLDGRPERGFSLGFFQEEYLQRCDIAVVKNPEGQIIAFASLMPNPSNERSAIDLMRFDYEATPNSTMDFLFLKLLLHCQAEGKRSFDLGMAPLSNVGVNENSFIHEKIEFLAYNFGERFYSFKGLRSYKQKFDAVWVPRYTCFSKRSWFLYTMIYLYIVNTFAVKNMNEEG